MLGDFLAVARPRSPVWRRGRRLPAVGTPLQRRPVTATRSRPSDFFVGMRLLGRGFGIVLSSPRLLVMGLVPGVIAAAVVLSGLAALVYYLDKVAAFVTPFADDWSADARNAVRLVASTVRLVSLLWICFICCCICCVCLNASQRNPCCIVSAG